VSIPEELEDEFSSSNVGEELALVPPARYDWLCLLRLVFINLNYNTHERQALRGRTRTVFHLSTPHIILYSFT
jgi:hypothetical protein